MILKSINLDYQNFDRSIFVFNNIEGMPNKKLNERIWYFIVIVRT